MKKRKTSKYRMSHVEILLYNLEKVTKCELSTDGDKDSARSLINWYLKNQSFTEKQIKYADVLVFRMRGKSSAIKHKKKVSKYFLYAIKSSDSVKIGMSSNPNKRLKTLQTSNKDVLRIAWRFYIGKSKKDAVAAEKKLHRFCNKYHQRGEWFGLDALNLISDFHP